MQASEIKTWLEACLETLQGRHRDTLDQLIAEHIVDVFQALERSAELMRGGEHCVSSRWRAEQAVDEVCRSTLKLLQARAACIVKTRIDRNEADWRATGLDVAPEPDQVPVWSDPA